MSSQSFDVYILLDPNLFSVDDVIPYTRGVLDGLRSPEEVVREVGDSGGNGEHVVKMSVTLNVSDEGLVTDFVKGRGGE